MIQINYDRNINTPMDNEVHGLHVLKHVHMSFTVKGLSNRLQCAPFHRLLFARFHTGNIIPRASIGHSHLVSIARSSTRIKEIVSSRARFSNTHL